MRVLLYTIFALSFTLSFSQTTIFLVRHAEKVDSSRDPDLSLDGKARAVRLMELLQDANVKAVYSTDYIRTRETARPLAEKRNLSVETYRPFDEAMVTGLKSSQAGNVLVVGHSNTIPDLVNKLIGETRYEQLADTEYSKLFVVTIDEDKVSHYILRF